GAAHAALAALSAAPLAPVSAAPPAPAALVVKARLPLPLDFLLGSGALRASFVFFVVEVLIYLFPVSFMRTLFALLISVAYSTSCYICWGFLGKGLTGGRWRFESFCSPPPVLLME
ncbi:hypothetical protein CCACVL1_03694, partial [Corchorus capsularis]